MKNFTKVALGALMLAGAATFAASAPAEARVTVGVGIGGPGYGYYGPRGGYSCDPYSRWYDPYGCGGYYAPAYYGYGPDVYIGGGWGGYRGGYYRGGGFHGGGYGHGGFAGHFGGGGSFHGGGGHGGGGHGGHH